MIHADYETSGVNLVKEEKLIVLGDFGSKELRNHHEVAMENSPQSRWDKTIKIARVIDHLTRYLRRELLDPRNEENNRELYNSAMEYRRLWETLAENGVGAMDYSKPLVGSSSQQRMFAPHLYAVRHKWRFVNINLEKATRSVLIFVAAEGGSAEQWATQQRCDRKYGIARLREALETITERFEEYSPPEEKEVDTEARITP